MNELHRNYKEEIIKQWETAYRAVPEEELPMAKLNLKQKQQIFDRKGEPLAVLAKDFQVSTTTICHHQKKRATGKRKIRKMKEKTYDKNEKPLSQNHVLVGFAFQDIIKDGKLVGHNVTIATEIKPLDGFHYDQFRQQVHLILKPFGR